MNSRAFLKGLLAAAVLVGVAWLWWQSTAPDLPANSLALTQSAAKPAIASESFKMPQIQKVEIVAPAEDVNDSAVSPAAETTTESDAAAQDKFPAATAARAYALAHQGDPSLPNSAQLTVPLDQSEHRVIQRLLGTGTTEEVSIEAYYRNPRGGQETVSYHIWNAEGLPGASGFEEQLLLQWLSPADQDYVRNWAKQQAVAAASAAANTPPPAAPEPPAPYVPPQPSGPTVITN
jgi:hypothetical protein